MTPKQTAIFQVAKLIGTALIAGIAINILFAYFTLTQIGIGACVIMLAFAIHGVYAIELDRAERLEKLNKSVDKA